MRVHGTVAAVLVGTRRRQWILGAWLAPGLACCCLLAACTGSADAPSAARVTRGSVPAQSASSPSSAAATSDPNAPITISFGGDVHFANQVADLLKNPEASLASLRPQLARADVSMVNLETAITSRGTEQPKQFHFRAPPVALDTIKAAGVDVVTMANNHAVDYGKAGLIDTLAAKKGSPIPIVGIGANAKEAYAAAYLKVRGHTIAVLGATQVPDWTLRTWPAGATRPGVAGAATLDQLAKAVRLAARRAELVIVYLHWGTDYTTCPNALQQRTARGLADAGAGLIVGAHAHRLMGAGWLGSTYVDFGLGNFVWWRRNSAADATTGVLTVAFDPAAKRVTKASWKPMMVTASGIPEVRTGDDGKRLLRNWNAARGCTGLASRP